MYHHIQNNIKEKKKKHRGLDQTHAKKKKITRVI